VTGDQILLGLIVAVIITLEKWDVNNYRLSVNGNEWWLWSNDQNTNG